MTHSDKMNHADMTLPDATHAKEIIRLTASELSEALSSRSLSAYEVTRAHLDHIEAVDSVVHAFLHVDRHGAETAARQIDEQRATGAALSPLAGVPIAIKDVLVTHDMPTTAGSRILEGWVSPYDATAVRKVREAGMIPLGKTNMDEFAMGSSTEHSAYGPTYNPWNVERVPGGSGGGSAAAVASFHAPLALGSDTGGSIRQPAHCTGTVGVKPTYGAVSRYGVIALASSFDQIGPVSRTFRDAALLHDVIAGHDPHDSTSLPDSWASMTNAIDCADLSGVRIGVVTQLSGGGFQKGVMTRFTEALCLLEKNGAEIVEVTAPSFEYAISAYYLILFAEASSNLAKFDSVRFGLRVMPPGGRTVEEVMSATRAVGFGSEVKRRIILGTYALSAGYYDAYYGSAQKVRTLVQRDFNTIFEKVDVVATPTAPRTAFALGEISDPLSMYMNDIATVPANLAGIPGSSQPIGLAPEDGLPVGLQFLAPARADARLYNVGGALERLLHEQWGGPLLDQAPDLSANEMIAAEKGAL